MKATVAIDMVALSHKLKGVAAKKKDVAKDRVYAAGDVFKDEAIDMAPEDTGALRHGSAEQGFRGIDADKRKGRKGPEVEVGAYAPYGAFHEFGTSEHGATPFIRPGLRIAVQHLKARVR